MKHAHLIAIAFLVLTCVACHPAQPAPGVIADGKEVCAFHNMKYISSDWHSNVQCRDENGTCHDKCATRLITLKCNQESSCASIGERT